MTSLMEASELPTTPLAGVATFAKKEPLLSDITLASVLIAALESIPAILSESLPAAKFAQQLYAIRPLPALAGVSWLRQLEQQDGNVLVLDRRGLTARGGLLPDDHLFKFMARKGLIRDNHVVWASRHPPLPPAKPATGTRSSVSNSTSAAHRAPSISSSAPDDLTTAAAPQPTDQAAAATAAAATPTVFNVYALSGAVCGHRGIVHGGLSSAIIDESFGYLLYLLSAAAAPPLAGQAGAAGTAAAAAAASVAAAVQEATRQRQPSCCVWEALLEGVDLRSAMTAHLEIDFLRPLPSGSTVACIAQVERIEGRKVWLQAQLRSSPPPRSATEAAASRTGSGAGEDGSVVYATGKALFIRPKPRG